MLGYSGMIWRGGLGDGMGEIGGEMGRHTFSTSLAKVGLMPTKDSVIFLTAVFVCVCGGVGVGVVDVMQEN